MTKQLFVLLFIINLLVSNISAEEPVSFTFSCGEKQGQLGIKKSFEGPESGPLALLASDSGFILLDVANNRIAFFNESGSLTSLIPLPPGTFKDMARFDNGTLVLADEEDRRVWFVEGEKVRSVFVIPTGEGYPVQFDLISAAGQTIAIMDYATKKLFFFDQSGTLVKSVACPPCLAMIGDFNSVWLLGMGDDDLYNRLINVKLDGVINEKKVDGAAFQGARLLAKIGENSFIVMGVESWSPMKRHLFIINKDLSTKIIDSIDYPLLFAARYGDVKGQTMWLNVSGIERNLIVVRKYKLN